MHPKPSVLIVEDDPLVLNMLRRMTTFAHHPTRTALSIREAQHWLKAELFAVVLLDLFLPDGNGADLIALIHQHNPLTAIVLITAQTDHRTIQHLLRNGADQHFQKPVDVTEVMDYLDHLSVGV